MSNTRAKVAAILKPYLANSIEPFFVAKSHAKMMQDCKRVIQLMKSIPASEYTDLDHLHLFLCESWRIFDTGINFPTAKEKMALIRRAIEGFHEKTDIVSLIEVNDELAEEISADVLITQEWINFPATIEQFKIIDEHISAIKDKNVLKPYLNALQFARTLSFTIRAMLYAAKPVDLEKARLTIAKQPLSLYLHLYEIHTNTKHYYSLVYCYLAIASLHLKKGELEAAAECLLKILKVNKPAALEQLALSESSSDSEISSDDFSFDHDELNDMATMGFAGLAKILFNGSNLSPIFHFISDVFYIKEEDRNKDKPLSIAHLHAAVDSWKKSNAETPQHGVAILIAILERLLATANMLCLMKDADKIVAKKSFFKELREHPAYIPALQKIIEDIKQHKPVSAKQANADLLKELTALRARVQTLETQLAATPKTAHTTVKKERGKRPGFFSAPSPITPPPIVTNEGHRHAKKPRR